MALSPASTAWRCPVFGSQTSDIDIRPLSRYSYSGYLSYSYVREECSFAGVSQLNFIGWPPPLSVCLYAAQRCWTGLLVEPSAGNAAAAAANRPTDIVEHSALVGPDFAGATIRGAFHNELMSKVDGAGDVEVPAHTISALLEKMAWRMYTGGRSTSKALRWTCCAASTLRAGHLITFC